MSVAVFKPYSEDSHVLYLVVGLGLIGARVAYFLSWHTRKLKGKGHNMAFDWSDGKQVSNILTSIIDEYQPKRIELAWCAGKAGFSATEGEMSAEFDTFSVVMKALKAQKGVAVTISFISSAGGIYENTPLVKSITDISPSRPYAFSKLKQEGLLNDLDFNSRIYRVSSVYGIAKKSARAGLINSLLNCAKTNKSITIYASQNTVRDYILNDDIARYVVKNMLGEKGSCLEIIASGRAVSIDALLKMISCTVKKKAKVVFLANNENSNNISFDRALLSKGLYLTSLEESIRVLSVAS